MDLEGCLGEGLGIWECLIVAPKAKVERTRLGSLLSMFAKPALVFVDPNIHYDFSMLSDEWC